MAMIPLLRNTLVTLVGLTGFFMAPHAVAEPDVEPQAVTSLADLSAEMSQRLAQQFPFLAKVPRVRKNDGDYVVLVHGFSWAKAPLRTLGRYLHGEGYHTIEIHYPTRSISIDEVLEQFVRPAIREHCTDPERRIHFVGHSMGCVMIRKLLTDSSVDALGNVVLLAAPNKGTEIADFFTRPLVLRRVLGESVWQIGTHEDSVPNQLNQRGPVSFSPGVIMGNRSDFPFVAAAIPGDDDGVVRVESGNVDGMADLLVLPTTHIRMPSEKMVRVQTVQFLRTGRFLK